MNTLVIVLVSVIGTLAVIGIYHVVRNVVRGIRLGSVTNNEMKVLRTVHYRWRKPLLRYLRTLEANRELQDYIVENPQCLKAVRRYMKKEFKPL